MKKKRTNPFKVWTEEEDAQLLKKRFGDMHLPGRTYADAVWRLKYLGESRVLLL